MSLIVLGAETVGDEGRKSREMRPCEKAILIGGESGFYFSACPETNPTRVAGARTERTRMVLWGHRDNRRVFCHFLKHKGLALRGPRAVRSTFLARPIPITEGTVTAVNWFSRQRDFMGLLV